MKALAYIRVSTDKQATNGVSLEAQEVAIMDYVRLHNSISPAEQRMEDVEILRDEGISGKNVSARPGMVEILAQVEAGEVGAIIVYKLDRLSRSVLDILNIMDLLKKKKVDFHSVSEKWDTSTAAGEGMLNLCAVFAQMQRRMIGENTSAALQATKRVTEDHNAALRHRKKANKLKIGKAPYGYRWEGEERSMDLVEDQAEMKAVGMMNRLHKAGDGYRIIAQKLKKAGLSTRAGGAWHPSTISRIVKRGYV